MTAPAILSTAEMSLDPNTIEITRVGMLPYRRVKPAFLPQYMEAVDQLCVHPQVPGPNLCQPVALEKCQPLRVLGVKVAEWLADAPDMALVLIDNPFTVSKERPVVRAVVTDDAWVVAALTAGSTEFPDAVVVREPLTGWGSLKTPPLPMKATAVIMGVAALGAVGLGALITWIAMRR